MAGGKERTQEHSNAQCIQMTVYAFCHPFVTLLSLALLGRREKRLQNYEVVLDLVPTF